MVNALKNLRWDLSDKKGRQFIKAYLIRNTPGNFGFYLRNKFYKNLFAIAGDNLRVFPGSYIIHPENISCGSNFFIGINNFIQAGGGLECGNYVMLGPSVKIWTQNHKFLNSSIPVLKQGYERKKVFIGNDVWIGANAFIMSGAIIGDGCIVSAGSVVSAKNYAPGTILAGNPARKIGNRFKGSNDFLYTMAS